MEDNLLETSEVVQDNVPVPMPEPTEAQTKKSAQQEYNYRILRERAEAAEARMAAMEKENNNRRSDSPMVAPVEDDDDFGLDNDSYVEAKHFKKSYNKLKNELKQTKLELQDVANKAILSATESRLKSNFNDFDQIVNSENLANLRAIHPEDYNSMMANPDLYGKSKTAYNMIKNYGLSNEKIRDADEKIAAHKAMPKSSSSMNPQVPESPLSRVGDYDRRILSEAQKDQIRKRLAESKTFSR